MRVCCLNTGTAHTPFGGFDSSAFFFIDFIEEFDILSLYEKMNSG